MSQYYTDTDEDGIQALGAELTDDDAPVVDETVNVPNEDGEVEETPEKPAKKESSKTAVPEGYEAPVAFAKRIGLDTPQKMYGYVKNNKALAEHIQDRGEGVTPRQVIHIEGGLAWWESMKSRDRKSVV